MATTSSTAAGEGSDPAPIDLRDYRNPATSDADRDDIRQYWAAHDIRNQFGAMLRAAELEQAEGRAR